MGVMLLKQMVMLAILLFIKGAIAQNTKHYRSVAKPGCEERCGNLVVPYPFGIGPNCSASKRMDIYCNNSFNPPKAFSSVWLFYYESPDYTTSPIKLEVLNISVEAGTIHINYPITTDCTNTTSFTPTVDARGTFTFSDTENRFTAMGCDNLALLKSWSNSDQRIIYNKTALGAGGCVSRCYPSQKKDNTCFGINCCQTQLPPSLWGSQPSLSSLGRDNSTQCTEGPRYAFIVDWSWFVNLKDINTVKSMKTVPAVLDWRAFGACQSFEGENLFPDNTLCGKNTLCTNQKYILKMLSGKSLCSCKKGYRGNPYLANGCQDIDECERYTDNKCEQICTNTPGSYYCSCKDGWVLVGQFKCVTKEVDHSVKKAAIIITATCAGLGVLLTATWWLYKVIRRRNTRKLEEKFFKRNGGLLLRQQVSSSQGNVETTKLFTSKELEKATDRYNIDRIVGQGGQGTVYKGMLTDGRIVAVKKSKIEDESKLEHFINEVVILSQINHRNVVKLHGCCLQTEVPLLVYEFIPNGTLMQYIHEDNEYFPLTWDVRLRVATEVAGALYYLHSAASIPIYHRDIKIMKREMEPSHDCILINAKGMGFPMTRTIPWYAFIVDWSWFVNLKDINTVKSMKTVPAVLDWRAFGACQSFEGENLFPDNTLCGKNTLCTNQKYILKMLSGKSLCSCKKGYRGNPYLADGCQDIDECERYTDNKCEQICTNTPGSYYCSCKDGWVLVGQFKCVTKEVDHSVKKAAIIITATCAGLGVLLTATWWLYKVIRRRNTRKLEEKFFKRNGGLLLRQQVSSSQGNVETTKLFTSKELEKATDRYNIDRIVGQGGQGTVYKGMLTDGRIVAVKKSKIEDESKLEHFINEVVILSQINHRNVVKLHGCCLQTEVPLLVYEFIPNGTLMQYIHEDNEYFPLTWDVRLRVATEVAGALYYLHSAASIPIYHRDIKSTNILLDDKYRAKVADFGTSRSISIDQTHQTTKVQGTFGYLDPEYFQSSQFTDKSDVYSFGVVLVELLTGQRPILAARLKDEARSLATLFTLAMEENRILDIIDSRITNVGKKEEIIAFANIAYRCLNLNGKKRPTMKQVVAELEYIKNTHESPTAQQNYEEVEYGKHELNAPWESDVTSSSMSSTIYHSLSLDM